MNRRLWTALACEQLLAIGGDLGGSTDDSIFPVTMKIDPVRVCQVPR